MELSLCAPCFFGLEGPLGNELRHMGMAEVSPETGRVRFRTDEAGLARANIRSRFAEKILLQLGRFPARSFDELFEGALAIPFEDYIPRDGVFPVNGWSVGSALTSVPACQRTVKKAASLRLGKAYGMSVLPESGERYDLRFQLLRDECAVYLNTSGDALYKRGYRAAQVEAPLRETIAAGLVDIAGYRGFGELCDPFCGSGTIAIEAALAAKRRAPGINRRFAAERWDFLPRSVWESERRLARDAEFHGEYHIFASDIDPAALDIARESARRAGVSDCVCFSLADAREFSKTTERGVVVTNPPYGYRLMTPAQTAELYADFGRAFRGAGGWDAAILSADPDFERHFGSKAKKRRRITNGKLECGIYIFK